MSIFDTLQKFLEMGQDPRLMDSAESIGRAAHEIPDLLGQMVALQSQTLEEIRGMRMDLDRLSDPIKRPPFSAHDVQAAMDGRWPVDPEPVIMEPNETFSSQTGIDLGAIRDHGQKT